jgi:outer membrane protein OmpA-like peptidoglycan-associated protein
MRPIVVAQGVALRRLAILGCVAAFAGLTACSSDETAGTAFTQALSKDYVELANQASSLPAPPSDEGFFESLFNIFGSSNPNEDLATALNDKADAAAAGDEPEPEAAPPDNASMAIRARLMRDIAQFKDTAPAQAAAAQGDYDCWVMASAVPSAAPMAQSCRAALDGALAQVEGGRVAPAPAPALPVPAPAPVPSAPIPPPPPVPAPAPAPAAAQPANTGGFTVYYDFDSWTLTAEDLKVITDVINTARAGGQGHITIVGHTDTSGPSDYNQRLSVRRANVVVEALVDLGARRAAITASGVGESDLAVETPDGVKEAQNRRAVVTLQP